MGEWGYTSAAPPLPSFLNFKFVVCHAFEYIFLKFLESLPIRKRHTFDYELLGTFALFFRQMKFRVCAVVFTWIVAVGRSALLRAYGRSPAAGRISWGFRGFPWFRWRSADFLELSTVAFFQFTQSQSYLFSVIAYHKLHERGKLEAPKFL